MKNMFGLSRRSKQKKNRLEHSRSDATGVSRQNLKAYARSTTTDVGSSDDVEDDFYRDDRASSRTTSTLQTDALLGINVNFTNGRPTDPRTSQRSTDLRTSQRGTDTYRTTEQLQNTRITRSASARDADIRTTTRATDARTSSRIIDVRAGASRSTDSRVSSREADLRGSSRSTDPRVSNRENDVLARRLTGRDSPEIINREGDLRGSSRESSRDGDNRGSGRSSGRVTEIRGSGRTTETLNIPGAIEAPSPVLDGGGLRDELQELRKEVQAIRRELMNELHVTRYDMLKEITMLKGTITQLATSMQDLVGKGVPQLSSEDQAAVSRTTTGVYVPRPSARQSGATAEPAKDDPVAMLTRASSRATALGPVDESALSKPLLQDQIDDLFPKIDDTYEVEFYARSIHAETREWVFQRVRKWLDSDLNKGEDRVLALVGDGGSGKSTISGALCDRLHEQIVGHHFCKFDLKSESQLRGYIFSLSNQLATNLPMFKNQLARLNLRYVVQESDALVLATKLIVEPLCAMEEPMDGAKIILIDGLDQSSWNGKSELTDFFALVIPQLPRWLGFFITSKPSPGFAQALPISSVIDFSDKNKEYLADGDLLIDEILSNFSDAEASDAKEILRGKSGGNFAYLEFTKQALSNPEVLEGEDGAIPIEVLHDLPDSLNEIFEEIFEDKFGKGRHRLWKKVAPLLEVITASASGPFELISEVKARDRFQYSKDDLQIIRRSFMDLVSIKNGYYRIDSSALFNWLTMPERADTQFYFDLKSSDQVLRRFASSSRYEDGTRRSTRVAFEGV